MRKEDENLLELGIPEKRQTCSICQRQFGMSAFDRHVTICLKSSNKKRSTFDSSEQRAVQVGDNVIPVKVLISKTSKKNYDRPSQTRSAKRNRSSNQLDNTTTVPPVIKEFCELLVKILTIS
ncbi:unnamed protein product, partial [Didymodactylos carnosus]